MLLLRNLLLQKSNAFLILLFQIERKTIDFRITHQVVKDSTTVDSTSSAKDYGATT